MLKGYLSSLCFKTNAISINVLIWELVRNRSICALVFSSSDQTDVLLVRSMFEVVYLSVASDH